MTIDMVPDSGDEIDPKTARDDNEFDKIKEKETPMIPGKLARPESVRFPTKYKLNENLTVPEK